MPERMPFRRSDRMPDEMQLKMSEEMPDEISDFASYN
jgi:hypothetical protein